MTADGWIYQLNIVLEEIADAIGPKKWNKDCFEKEVMEYLETIGLSRWSTQEKQMNNY